MKDEYRREMEQLGPRPEELERLYQMIEGGTEMKKQKRLGSRAAAVLACAALMVTAAAAAAPTVWEALQTHLGAFAPYAQAIDGAACTDQGIEMQVLSAVSDDLEARFYLAARDVEEDRLNEFLTLEGKLTAGEAKDPDREFPDSISVVGGFSSNVFKLISYDPGTKTALFSTSIYYLDSSRPTGEAKLSVSGMSTRQGTLYGTASCAAVTGTTLKSLPAGGDDKVILSPSDVQGTGYTDDVLPQEQVVLAPGQTPMEIEGTEDMRISSMGFASDGCFHVRLEFAEGVAPKTFEPVYFDTETGVNLYAGRVNSMLHCDLLDDGGDLKYHISQERLVEGGMDILFPLVKAEDLEKIRSQQARVYGTYTRPGTDIEGSWSAEFEVDYYPSVTLDWTGKLLGWDVRQVTVSPLSVTMSSNSHSSFHTTTLYAVKKDGSAVAAEPGTGSYENLGALTGEDGPYEAYNTWKFEEPVDLKDVVSLKLGDGVIPVN